MAHTFEFIVRVSVDRDSGKFASRDEIAEQLRDAIEGADPGSVSGVGADGDSEYSVGDWTVEDK
jgi:hypothetical protein